MEDAKERSSSKKKNHDLRDNVYDKTVVTSATHTTGKPNIQSY